METTGLNLKALTLTLTRFHYNFRTHFHFRINLLRPLCTSHHLKRAKCLVPALCCSLSDVAEGTSLPRGVGEAINDAAPNRLLQVVLVSPQIPGNTGCIARTCAAAAVGLHLVEPLGYRVDDAKLKRAGLDYWPYVVIKVHGSWTEFRNYFKNQGGGKRLLAFTKRGKISHSEFSYKGGDWLVFGSETNGLPPEALLDCDNSLRIPMVETYVRCLNLSVSVGIAVYEASRQLNYEQLQLSSNDACFNGQDSMVAEDIFG